MSLNDVIGLHNECRDQVTKLEEKLTRDMLTRDMRRTIFSFFKRGYVFRIPSPYHLGGVLVCTIKKRTRAVIRYSFPIRTKREDATLQLMYTGYKFLMRITSIRNTKGELVYRRSDFLKKRKATKSLWQ